MPTPSGSTPQYGLPYLLESDVPDVATASQMLAQAVENVLKTTRVGTVEFILTSTAPTGAVLLQGQTVSRTGTYAALFAKWGTRFGSGNGSTTFTLPNFGGVVPVGYKSGTSTFGTLGAKVGAISQTLTVSQIPSMTPTITCTSTVHDPEHSHVATPGYATPIEATSTVGTATPGDENITFDEISTSLQPTGISVTTVATSSAVGTVSNTPVSIVQPSLVVNFIAWYE